ncbi:Histone deacetylation protein Rxt3 protein [Dioscorea alata]|uniref:Histone deacetylation protein Rxt3 protein n=3 Tax=Dioscorea alata TaxID=55571 RepID=A0ACB7UHK2_DIOAL|nr:Histone deacetylation protein Rxt3 protein [Dioscorea alata]KAH7659706.1 Histone deacetylation protein Rxt3 protein [Dioscorea alata]KAH7659708.1 Histone deacetylation protein Rxt3 protein [Dioscorea alata]
MSGAPKRVHEDGGHSASLKRPLDETSLSSGVSGKLIQSVGNDFHLPFEHGSDGRMAKVPRTESRDVDKRSSLVHRMSPSSNNPVDHPITSDSRPESRNLKDVRDTKTDHRETKAEIRDLYPDMRMDSQGGKGEIRENDARLDGKGEEKELRSDRGSHGIIKSEIKFDKDGHTISHPYSSWKESKENHRGKRHFEFPSDGFDSWRVSRHGLQTTEEGARDFSMTEDRVSAEGREAVGENKVHVKGDDKLRDMDRKRKDEKHRDFGERDKDRNDWRNNMLQGSASNERKDPMRDDRDMEKTERDRKDAQKDKERIDKEMDSTKLESSNVNEKENAHYQKEMIDGSARNTEQETAALDPKSVKDESWKSYERDAKDKRRERDADAGDISEHRGRCYEKESEDACIDGVAERDREALVSGVQQRTRMLRSRGAPQAPHREPRFRSRTRENEGSQVKSEASSIVYKVGECMQELLKSWKEFEAAQEDKNGQSLQNGPTLEIRIPAEYVIATNHQVKGAQLWGTDIYTNDSDLVAVLMHTGYCRPTASPPPSAIQELRATVRVLPPQDCYTSTLRNNVRSRAWGAGIGCSFRVERCCIVKKGGGMIDLEPRLAHMSAVEPSLAPVSAERTMTTRAAASNALRQQRFVHEVTIQYNLCNEPWLKYSISVVADKGLKKPLYTSARLKKGEVLYLETHFTRYELCFNGEKAVSNGTIPGSSHVTEAEPDKVQNHSSHVQTTDKNMDRENIIDVFRWSRCKKPLPQNIMRSIGIPLPLDHLEVLEENLSWEDVQWSQTGVWVAEKEYVLARAHFLSPN